MEVARTEEEEEEEYADFHAGVLQDNPCEYGCTLTHSAEEMIKICHLLGEAGQVL